MRVGENIGLGWTLAAARPPFDEDLGGGVVRRQPGVFRAERRMASGALANLQAATEAELLERIANWAANENRRKDGGELADWTPAPAKEPQGEEGGVAA